MTSSPPPGHWARISLAVRTQLMSTPPDLWLVSSEGYSLPTHTSLLTLHSPLLKTLLLSSNFSPWTSSTLSLPVPALPLRLLLSLLSEGSVSHDQPFNPLEVLEAAELLGIDIDIHVANQDDQTPENSRQTLEPEGLAVKEELVANEDAKEDGVKWMDVVKEGEDGTFQCKSCDYKTTRKSNKGNMTRHIKTVHLSNSPLFKCPLPGCTFRTQTKGRMRAHNEGKHNGVRFDCGFCEYQTPYRENLGKHVEARHADEPAFAWPCDLCNFKGLNASELKSHNKIKHERRIYKQSMLQEKI